MLTKMMIGAVATMAFMVAPLAAEQTTARNAEQPTATTFAKRNLQPRTQRPDRVRNSARTARDSDRQVNDVRRWGRYSRPYRGYYGNYGNYGYRSYYRSYSPYRSYRNYYGYPSYRYGYRNSYRPGFYFGFGY
ncbi:MAG: hypothetical protein KDA59_11100 [Planctomycetales bacterium]|nr:hypothetical protein [Planctomycetales bacterium]MCA9203587.1 hypothetical protein [Planctomycetales bacterium]